MRKPKHEMIFTSYPDLTTASPTTLVAHRLTRADLERYDGERGCFRGQRLRFAYSDIAPKVGEFLVRFGDSERFPVATGIVTLVGAKRLFEIIGDKKALDALGTMEDEAACL